MRLVKDFLRSQHLEIRKSPSVKCTPLPVFDLATERLMQLRGDALRFIQVGANDGIAHDPLRKFVVERGWRGILCEPQEGVFSALKANYAEHADRLIFENVAISPDAGGLRLYHAPGVNLTVSSTNAATTARQTGVRASDLIAVTVPTLTLDALVERHDFQGFDLLQIDVEGYDLAVLKTLSLDRHRPGVIQFEHGHLSRVDVTEAGRFLKANNYALYYGGAATDSVAMPLELIG